MLASVRRASSLRGVDFDDLDVETLRRRRGAKWTRYPDDVLPAWVADMDFAVAPPIREGLMHAVETHDLGYAPGPGELRRVFCSRLEERFGWKVPTRRVAVLTDVVQGLYLGVQLFSEPGEGVVIQTPIYPPFLRTVAETGRRMVENALVRTETRFEIDLGALADAIDPQTRILMLCHPHNPTGRHFDRSELEALGALAVERDLTVISDEIHCDLVLDGSPHVPFATLGDEVAARTITLMSASKAFNIAGLHCAFAIFGSDEQRAHFDSIVPRTRGAVNSLGILASLCAYKYGQSWLDDLVGYLRGNRDWLAGFLAARAPEIRFSPPEATYLAWLDCRALKLDVSPQQFFLERARVALNPGAEFGAPGEGFVRLNFATSRAILEEIAERIVKVL